MFQCEIYLLVVLAVAGDEQLTLSSHLCDAQPLAAVTLHCDPNLYINFFDMALPTCFPLFTITFKPLDLFNLLTFLPSTLQPFQPSQLSRLVRNTATSSTMSVTAWTDEDVRASLVPQNEFPTCSYRRGACASVYKVLNVKTGGLFAGKSSPQAADHLREEARNLTKLNHVSEYTLQC
jgi:hypothetical protein